MAAAIMAPATPVAADSDGVAIPSIIRPMTEKMTRVKGIRLRTDHSLRPGLKACSRRRPRSRFKGRVQKEAEVGVDQDEQGQEQAGGNAGDEHAGDGNIHPGSRE